MNDWLVQEGTALIYVFDNASYLIEKDIGVCKYASVEDGILTIIVGTSTKDGYSERKISKQVSDIVQESNLLE